MSKDLISKLGIKTGGKVCLIHPNEETLAQIRQGRNITVIIDRVEKDCDVILYRVDSLEDIKQKMQEFQNSIEPDGRIWVVIPRKEVAREKGLEVDWNRMQKEVLKTTHLVDNKVASINDEEYGTQFMIRRESRGEK